MRDTQSGIKSEMKESIAKNAIGMDIQRISVEDNAGSIAWEDQDKNEFVFNGKMYDVVKTVKENGKTIIYCINDRKEKSLIDEYNNATKENTSHGKKLMTENPITLFVYERDEYRKIPVVNSRRFLSKHDNFTSAPSEIISPPPRL